MSVPSRPSEILDRSVGRSSFGGDAAGYDSARSGYPMELFDNLAAIVAASPRILEIGAGTGLATQGLLCCAPRHLALVEPDPRLCAFLEKRFFNDGVEVQCGTFSDCAITGPFDLIACAAAFHWLEPTEALSRIRALLSPTGIWAMWWNCYFGHGVADPFGERVGEILTAHSIALSPSYVDGRHYALDTSRHITLLRDFGFQDIHHQVFRTERKLDAAQAKALYQSFSFISRLPDDARSSFLSELGTMIARDFDGVAPSIVVTSQYSSRH